MLRLYTLWDTICTFAPLGCAIHTPRVPPAICLEGCSVRAVHRCNALPESNAKISAVVALILLGSAAALSARAGQAPAANADSAPAAPVAQATTPAPAGDGAGPATATGSDQLAEVIVTASRHAEDVQKESRPIDVLSGQQLSNEGVTGLQGLNTLVPGVQVGSSGDQLQVYVRGVGDRTVTAQTEPGVALMFDGVYLPRAWEAGLIFFDTDRVEILKGPQGTLYGRNASAGAMNVIPNLPSTSQFGGDLEGMFGNYAEHMFTGNVNVPIGSDFALRASFQTNNHSGYLSDGSDDADSQAARLQFLYKPSDDLSLRFDGMYTENGGYGNEFVTIPNVNPKNPWIAEADNAPFQALITSPAGFLLNGYTGPGSQDISTWIALLDLEWRVLPGATLTVLPAVVDGEEHVFNFPVITEGEHTHSLQSSLEVRLASSDTSAPLVPGLQWVFGAYASHEQLNEVNIAEEGAILGTLATLFPKLDDTTWAVFGEGKYSVTDRLRAIGGVRYTWERKTADGSSVQTGGVSPPANSPFSGAADFSKVNYRAGLEYDVTPQSMAYATVSTGFKAGGFYAAPPPNTYQPENLTAYELGIKNRFFDNRLQFNLELFDWDYRNLQEQFISVLSNGGVGLVTQNAAKSTLRGFDVQLSAALSQYDTFSAEAEYNRARYDNYQYDTLFLGPPSPITTGCVATTSPTDHLNCSGFQLVKAPLWSGSVAYQHMFPFANGSDLAFRAEEHFSSAYWLADDFIPSERAPAWAFTNLFLTYTMSPVPLTLSAYVENLQNKAVYTYGVESPATPGIDGADIGPPRTYGVRIRYSF